MKIGISAIHVRPGKSGSHQPYLVNLVSAISKLETPHEFILFVTPANQYLFENSRKKMEFVTYPAPADEDATIHCGQPRGLLEIPGQVIAKERFLHFASPTLDKYVRKMVHHYSTCEAQDRFNKKGIRPNLGMLIFWPLKTFIGSYFYRMGFLDGLQGFILSVVWAFTRFLVSAHLYDLEAGRRDDDPWAGMVIFPENYSKSVEERLNRFDLT